MRRQIFFYLLSQLIWLLSAAPLGGQQRYELLLKGGHVLDPAHNIDRVMDVAVAAGRIARVAPDIAAAEAARTVDVRGLYVTPGLIDLHAHHYGYSGAIFPDDAQLAAGTTTSVDCGGPGWRSFDEFKAKIVDRATLLPARAIGRPELGSLREGGIADLAVFEIERGRFGFLDSGRARLAGDRNIRAVMTIRAGEIVWDADGRSRTDWLSAGPYSNYR